eukprot:TRINITY_DN11962_c0_g1_i1.p2 TRINITY_DN11962_c0_g1~~TRINITY_DN11962_c0_g1_i1.p2  ORF type:complete len:181 (-),score=3.34 TRINITY_DN11962_c0_g1_i1:56-574(-)
MHHLTLLLVLGVVWETRGQGATLGGCRLPTEEFQACGSACPPTCAEPGPRPCIRSCNEGCFCRAGMLRSPDGSCVLPSDCPRPVGGADEHGCIAGAGYTWCDPRGKCLRPWEESCTPLGLNVGSLAVAAGCVALTVSLCVVTCLWRRRRRLQASAVVEDELALRKNKDATEA